MSHEINIVFQGNYPKSTEFFSKAYNISRSLNQTNAIHSSRVFYGISSAHNMLQGVADHINIASHPCLERLVEWKNNRGDEFEKPLPGNGDSHFIISVNGSGNSHYTQYTELY